MLREMERLWQQGVAGYMGAPNLAGMLALPMPQRLNWAAKLGPFEELAGRMTARSLWFHLNRIQQAAYIL